MIGQERKHQGFQQPNLLPTSIEDLESSFGIIKVFPNPTTQTLIIAREKGQRLEVKLMDMRGKVVKEESLHQLRQEWDLSELAMGFYELRMSDGKKTARTIKIEKK